MAKHRVGTIFVELDLDPSRYMRAQQTMVKESKTGAKILEKNFKNLGIKSGAAFDLMRNQAVQSFEAIKRSGKATAQDLVRAEKAKAEKIKQINEEQYGHHESTIQKLKKNWVAASAAIIAAWYAISKAVKAVSSVVLAAARYETLGVVMRVVGNNAGFSGKQMEAFAKGLEATGISASGSRQALVRMAQAQLDLTKSSQLARIAQDAAVIGNINSTEAFNQMVYGIQSANVRVLRTIGINVQFQESYQRVAKQLGRTATSFTEAEKAGIRLQTVLDAGPRIAGAYEGAMETAGKQLLSLERHFDNLRVLAGAAFTPALAEIIGTITGSLKDLNGALSGEGKKKIEAWGVSFRLSIIRVEAEIMRLAMLLDKIGGTWSSAKMLLYGPGTELGFESSTKRFEAAAEQNLMYEQRYIETEIALQALANKTIALEQSLTPKAVAAAKAKLEVAEKVRLVAVKAAEEAKRLEAEKAKSEETAAALTKKLMDQQLKDIEKLYTAEVKRANNLGKMAMMDQKWTEKAEAEKQKAIWETGMVREAGIEATRQAEEKLYKDVESAVKRVKVDSDDTFKDLRTAVAGWASSWSSSLNDMLWGSERTFANIAQSFGKMITQMIIQQTIVKPMLGQLTSLFPSAHGNVFSGAGISAYENQVVTKPTFFASGGNVMGEAGPEAILPLTRTSSGDLGVKAEKSGAPAVNLYVSDNMVYDRATMEDLIMRISSVVANKIAPEAVIRSYNRNEPIRSIMRGAI